MYKKFLMLSFVFIFSLSSNVVFAGDAEKVAFKKCAACHNVAEGAKHKTGQICGKFMVQKQEYRKVINILNG